MELSFKQNKEFRCSECKAKIGENKGSQLVFEKGVRPTGMKRFRRTFSFNAVCPECGKSQTISTEL